MEFSVILILIFVCVVAFSLPFMMTRARAPKLYSSDLVIPNTGLGSATATQSTERAMTIAAFADLFASPTGTQALTRTFTAMATLTSTLTSSPTFTLSPSTTPTPTRTVTLIPIQLSATDEPKQVDTRVPTREPSPQPTRTPPPQPTNIVPVPTKTEPAPTIPPPQQVTPLPPTVTPEPPPTEPEPTAEPDDVPPTQPGP